MTLGEVLVASAITVTLMGSVLSMTAPLQRMFETQPEYGDMHQRMRGAVEALTRDLIGAASPVMPYRAGVTHHDPDAGVFYRPDTITLVPPAWDPGGTSHTYYLRRDPATGTTQLMRYDGLETDLPLADHVTRLEFAYFLADGAPPSPGLFEDGPWFPDDHDRNRFDLDLLRVRRVRVTLRVQAAPPMLRRFLPDREISFDVAPRNLNRE
jgi:hypothetical protein